MKTLQKILLIGLMLIGKASIDDEFSPQNIEKKAQIPSAPIKVNKLYQDEKSNSNNCPEGYRPRTLLTDKYKEFEDVKKDSITNKPAEKKMIQRLKEILQLHQSYPKCTSANGINDYFYLYRNKSKLEESTNQKIQELYKRIIEKYFPGTYIVVHKKDITVTNGFSLYSEDIRKIEYKTRIEIIKVQKNDTERRIRGQLSDGNWVSIEDLDDGYNWILPHTNKRTRMTDTTSEKKMIQRLQKILNQHQSYPTQITKNCKQDVNYLYHNNSKLEESTNKKIQNLYKKIISMKKRTRMKDTPAEKKMIQRLQKILNQHQSYPTQITKNGKHDVNYLYHNNSKLEKSTNKKIQELYKKIISMKDEPAEKKMIQRLQEILDLHQSYPKRTSTNGKDYFYLYNNKSKLEKSTNKKIQELYKKIITMKDILNKIIVKTENADTLDMNDI